jgi:zinc protease
MDSSQAIITRGAQMGSAKCERALTSNGVKVAVWPSTYAPVVRLRMHVPAGADHEPDEAYGVASLVAPLIRAANRQHALDAVELQLESLGADAVIDVEWQGASITMDVLARDAVAALDLLLDLAAYPAFPQNAIEAMRARRLEQLRQQAHDPATLATSCFYRALFPGVRDGAPLMGTADGLARVSRDTIVDFHACHYAAHLSSLIVTGDANPEALMQRAERYALSSERESGGSLKVHNDQPIQTDDPSKTPRVLLVDRPDAPHTELRVGLRSIAQTHPDALSLQVLGALLGGTSFSRLGQRLRRESGYSYHVVGRFALRRTSGAFVTAASVPSERAGRAVSDVLGEVAKVCATRVSAREIASAAGQLEATLFQSWCCIAGQADRLTYMLANDLGDDYGEQCLDAIRSMTPDRLIELARTHLPLERMTVVAVGPASLLRPQLEHIGDVIECE